MIWVYVALIIIGYPIFGCVCMRFGALINDESLDNLDAANYTTGAIIGYFWILIFILAVLFTIGEFIWNKLKGNILKFLWTVFVVVPSDLLHRVFKRIEKQFEEENS